VSCRAPSNTATDEVCSSTDKTHEALLTLCGDRCGEQMQAATAETIPDSRSPEAR